ncbi:CIC11C00000005787 [Sungouiella intermedia]|uniref:CIC11C00000005787 n=1 Tax=Sungouiella intermedia TaxID=45354 RepID=A0A1L0CWH9_9ASCO|nr:CIC11C00000005787 [[Candida] intermedia]
MNNLMSLDISNNDLIGHINFNKFNFPNLQVLNLAENKLQLVTGLECVPNLRVLNINDNRLEGISCLLIHRHLKKLSLKFNRLKKLSVEPFPFLRILRIDGNSLDFVSDLKKLKFLLEMSAKCQDNPNITEQIVLGTQDIVTLDLSGNYVLSSLLSGPLPTDLFANLNQLNLSAVGLTSIPDSFGKTFGNVRELNINFNKLTSLEGLTMLCRLKKITAVSNNMSKMEMILNSLCNSRKTLKLLDLRLNVFNFEFYPYVFNPHELELANASNVKNFDSSPIPLEAHDDIENFSIHYNTLVKSREEWEERDADFFARMRAEGNYKRINERLNYETILIKFFPKLKNLDGSHVSLERRNQMESRIHLN